MTPGMTSVIVKIMTKLCIHVPLSAVTGDGKVETLRHQFDCPKSSTGIEFNSACNSLMFISLEIEHGSHRKIR